MRTRPGRIYMTHKRKLSLSEKLQMHVYHTRPILNRQALFADGGPEYVIPCEPSVDDLVRLRLRTARDNVEHAYVYLQGEALEMTLVKKTELFDYYEEAFRIGSEPVDYYFEVVSGTDSWCYNKKGPGRTPDPTYHFRLIPGFSTPDWAKGAVMYQIFVDRFANGNPDNDVLDHEYVYIKEHVSRVTDWYKYPAPMGVREFYGGDLQGILDHLDYLCDLGIDVLYLNPIFVSPSNHKYDIQDYDYVDPHFTTIPFDQGELLPDWATDNTHAARYISRVTDKRNLEASNEFFIHFVEEVHKRGLKVILDGVFNHCGSFNKWMDAERIYEFQPGYEKGAYVDAASPYHDFFRFYDNSTWPYNDEYDGWWGHKTLPKLNYEGSFRLYDYILRIAAKWVSPPYNADGWRLDVAADIGHSPEMNHRFFKDFRRVVKTANPEAIILAEHYGDPKDWLEGDQWDTVMNYNAFMEPATWFFTGMEKHSDAKREDLLGNGRAFWDAMKYHMSRMQYPSYSVSMNELSNHDHSRFLTRTGGKIGRTATLGPEEAATDVNKAVMRAAVVMQMTWPGAPTIYYGDEAGVTGWTDPDNRRTYPWGHEDQELIRFHRVMISIHKEYEALKTGSLLMLEGTGMAIAYGRFKGKEKIAVILNAGGKEIPLSLPVWKLGVTDKEHMKQMLMSREYGYSLSFVYHRVDGGMCQLILPAHCAMVLIAV